LFINQIEYSQIININLQAVSTSITMSNTSTRIHRDLKKVMKVSLRSWGKPSSSGHMEYLRHLGCLRHPTGMTLAKTLILRWRQ